MFEQYQIKFQQRNKSYQILSALLTLAAGILTLIYPTFLYLIAGGYLIALGIYFLSFKLPSFIVALPIIAGLVIIIFPALIPFTFAAFLIFFGIILFVLFKALGILSILIAVLILMNPDLVAYFVAFFMLVYAVSEIIGFINNPKGKEKDEFQDWEEVDSGQ